MKFIIKDKRIFSLWRIAGQAFGAYKLQIIVLSALGFLGGILEGVGVNAIIPLFSFISGGAASGDDFISRSIARLFALLGADFRLKYLLVFIVILFIFKALTLLAGIYIRLKITTDYENNLRNDLLQKTLRAQWPRLIQQKIGHLETTLVTDVHQSAQLLEDLAGSVLLVTTLATYILVALNISVQITLLTLAFGAILFLIFKPLIAKKRLVAQQTANLYKDVAHFINEHVYGLKTIKAMAVENYIARRARDYFNQLRTLTIKSQLLSNSIIASTQPVSMIFVVVVFAFSYTTADFNFAAFAAIIYLIQKMFVYIEKLQTGIHKINAHFPFLQQVLHYREQIEKDTEKDQGGQKFKFKSELAFKDVSFNYPGGQAAVLSQVSFNIRRGEMVGLIGASGAGKTTIVDLLLRLLEPQAGNIALDGVPLENISLASWRNNVGYVSQDIFLLNDTIENNIKFYDETITAAAVEQAAKRANIDDFIHSTPKGYKTVMGERGLHFSAGQRQRITIARVLARRPEILILDEATSALDNESEARIQKSIESLRGQITVLTIAHRLSTVMSCDRLLVLSAGRIIEQGRPQDLLKDRETYFYKAYNIQA